MQPDTTWSWKERMKRYAIGVPTILCIYLVLILFYIYPHWPIDLIGWIILILAGMPTLLLLEFFGEAVFSKKAGMKISGKNFSAMRIIFSIFVIGIISGASVLLWIQFGSHIRPHFG